MCTAVPPDFSLRTRYCGSSWEALTFRPAASVSSVIFFSTLPTAVPPWLLHSTLSPLVNVFSDMPVVCLIGNGPNRNRAPGRLPSVTEMKLRLRRPSAGTLIALVALFVALGGPAEAARLINGKLIKKGTVRSAQVKNRSLSTVDLSSRAVRSLMATPSGSIRSTHLAPGAVTGDRLAASSVGSATIADDSITAADIAAGAVTNSELRTSAVSRSKIGNNAVAQSELVDGAVSSAEVGDGTLAGRDVGAFTGVLTIDFPAVAAEECEAIEQDVAPVVAGADITDDAIVVTPPAAWPDDLTLTVRPVSATRIRLVACNPTDPTTPLPVDAPSGAFRYISFAA